jgi:hypothetical protein
MAKVMFHIVLDDFNQSLLNSTLDILMERLRYADPSVRLSRYTDCPTITCKVYLQQISWRDFFHLLRQIKGNIEASDIQVMQIIVDEEQPDFDLLGERRGFWIRPNYVPSNWVEELIDFLRRSEARRLGQEWFYIPFSSDAPDEEDAYEYEICLPSEKIREFGVRVNGSSKRRGVPVGIRLRTAVGTRLSDYIETAFHDVLKLEHDLGGFAVIITTLLQMNDKLHLVNHYSERLSSSERLNLYSLASMNLSITDERSETDIAVLVESGKISIRDIRLGE